MIHPGGNTCSWYATLDVDSYLLARLYVLYNTKPTPIPVFSSTMAMVVMLVIEVMKSCLQWKSGEYYGSIVCLGNRREVGQAWPELPSKITIPCVLQRMKNRSKKDIKREEVKIIQPFMRLRRVRKDGEEWTYFVPWDILAIWKINRLYRISGYSWHWNVRYN